MALQKKTVYGSFSNSGDYKRWSWKAEVEETSIDSKYSYVSVVFYIGRFEYQSKGQTKTSDLYMKSPSGHIRFYANANRSGSPFYTYVWSGTEPYKSGVWYKRASWTDKIQHNADGTKSWSQSFSFSNCEGEVNPHYGSMTISMTLTKIVTTPSTPSTFTVKNQTMNVTDNIRVGDVIRFTWTAASGATSYDIQFSKAPQDSTTFGSFTNLLTGLTGTSRDWTFPTTGHMSGSQFKFRIIAKNSSGSSSAKAATNTMRLLGCMRVKVGNVWKTGTVYVKQSGAWKRAKDVLTKQTSWKHSK